MLSVLLLMACFRVSPSKHLFTAVALGAVLLTLGALMRTLEGLGRRIPDSRLVRHSRLVVLFATVVAGILATYAYFGPSYQQIERKELPVWMAVFGVGSLGTVLLYAYTLGCIRRHRLRLKQIQAACVEREKVVDSPFA